MHKSIYIHLHVCPTAWSGLGQTSALLPYRYCWIQRPLPWCPNWCSNSCHGNKIPRALNTRPIFSDPSLFLLFPSHAISRLMASYLLRLTCYSCKTGANHDLCSFYPSVMNSVHFILLLLLHIYINASLHVLTNLCAPLIHTH